MFRLPSSPDRRSAVCWAMLRVVLAGLLAVHGWARLLAGGVVPFGVWLESQGFPFGFAIASTVTAIEILGTVLFAVGIRVWPLSLLLAAIYTVGAVLVHLPAGWFVVGLGRNGMEYSALLIACLLLVGVQHRRPKTDA
jgi:putative oxidoreductase